MTVTKVFKPNKLALAKAQGGRQHVVFDIGDYVTKKSETMYGSS